MAEKTPVASCRRRVPLWILLLLTFSVTALAWGAGKDKPRTEKKAPVAAATAQAAADKAEELYDEENYAAALAEFEKALAGGLRSGRLLYKAAYCQQVTGKPQNLFRSTMLEAVKVLDQVVQDNKKARLQDHFYLQAAYAAVGDTGTAHRLTVRAIEAYKKGTFGPLENLDSRDQLRLAQMAAGAGDTSLQLEALDRATAALAGGDQSSRHRLARALVDVGRLQMQSDHLDAAAEAISRALEIFPKAPGARLLLARIFFRQKHYPEAAEQWYRVRQETPARATEAIYVHQVMLTLTQEQLLDKSRPLQDLQKTTRAQIEQEIDEKASEFRKVAQLLPEDLVKRGYAGKKIEPEARTNLKKLRDLKYRLAWAVAWYTDRGLPIREFAFRRGFQSALRVWKLLKANLANHPPGPLPDWLTDEERAHYAARQDGTAAAGKKRQHHQARKKQQAKPNKRSAKRGSSLP